MTQSTPKTYLVESVVHATQVLGAFAAPGETLRLRDVVERTRFTKGLCFRLLHTLHHNRYRLTCDIRPRKR
jgi:DNA-binding IclR family transcriptional regulator